MMTGGAPILGNLQMGKCMGVSKNGGPCLCVKAVIFPIALVAIYWSKCPMFGHPNYQMTCYYPMVHPVYTP